MSDLNFQYNLTLKTEVTLVKLWKKCKNVNNKNLIRVSHFYIAELWLFFKKYCK